MIQHKKIKNVEASTCCKSEVFSNWTGSSDSHTSTCKNLAQTII